MIEIPSEADIQCSRVGRGTVNYADRVEPDLIGEVENMAFSTTETITTTKSVQETIAAAQDTLTSLGLVPSMQGQELTAKSGSFVKAGLMGYLTPAAAMPVRLTVRVEDSGASRVARITAEDAYPLPLKFGIMGKIRHQVGIMAQQTRDGLQKRLA
jgi:hypothetical protein